MLRSGPIDLIGSALSTRYHPHHFDLPFQATLPFTEISEPGELVNGGLSSVFDVVIYLGTHLNTLGIQNEDKNSAGRFAVKCLSTHSHEKFRKEVDMLVTFSGNAHEHLISLLATYQWHHQSHLLFSLAEGHLQDFWRSQPSLAAVQQTEDRSNLLSRTTRTMDRTC